MSVPTDKGGISPILNLEPYILSAAHLIAPERTAELATIIDDKKLKLELSFERHDISIDVSTGYARLGITSLEHLWAASHFYYCLYSDYASAQRTDSSKFDITLYPRSNSALRLLNWATIQWKCRSRSAWPNPLIIPQLYPTPLSDEHVANEIFLSALAWTVHHEYGHARLGHSNLTGINARREEKDADLAATDWVLSAAPTEKHLRKRGLGVIVGILALDVLEFAQNDPLTGSHPPAFERLSYCLNKYAQQDDDEAFAFALCGMLFNSTQRGANPSLDGASFREILDSIFLARSARIRNG